MEEEKSLLETRNEIWALQSQIASAIGQFNDNNPGCSIEGITMSYSDSKISPIDVRLNVRVY